MGEYYGLDLSRPAYTAQEAVQWVYMAYLAAVKEQDGAAMSLGNVSSFLDIYLEYELSQGTITETFAQELIDQFVIKLRMVRHLRMQSYNDIFAGDPTWVTESIGGRFNDGRTKVTTESLVVFHIRKSESRFSSSAHVPTLPKPCYWLSTEDVAKIQVQLW